MALERADGRIATEAAGEGDGDAFGFGSAFP